MRVIMNDLFIASNPASPNLTLPDVVIKYGKPAASVKLLRNPQDGEDKRGSSPALLKAIAERVEKIVTRMGRTTEEEHSKLVWQTMQSSNPGDVELAMLHLLVWHFEMIVRGAAVLDAVVLGRYDFHEVLAEVPAHVWRTSQTWREEFQKASEAAVKWFRVWVSSPTVQPGGGAAEEYIMFTMTTPAGIRSSRTITVRAVPSWSAASALGGRPLRHRCTPPDGLLLLQPPAGEGEARARPYLPNPAHSDGCRAPAAPQPAHHQPVPRLYPGGGGGGTEGFGSNRRLKVEAAELQPVVDTLRQRYKMKFVEQAYCPRSKAPNQNRIVVYHGTYRSYVDSILADGLQPSTSGVYGPGVYTTRRIFVAKDYGDGPILRIEMDPGSMAFVTDPNATSWQHPGIDSGLLTADASHRSYEEWIIRNPSKCIKSISLL
eukprot:gene7938-biopygen5326